MASGPFAIPSYAARNDARRLSGPHARAGKYQPPSHPDKTLQVINTPVKRKSPPTGPSRKYAPPSETYTPTRAGPSYRHDFPNIYRPPVWRPPLPSYHNVPSSLERYGYSRPGPVVDAWDRRNTWDHYSDLDRKPIPTAPAACFNRGRRDTLATPMLEPSDSWKQSNHSRPNHPEGGRPPSTDQYLRPPGLRETIDERSYRPSYYYTPGGDRYRPPQPSSVNPYPPRSDCYRPHYDNPWARSRDTLPPRRPRLSIQVPHPSAPRGRPRSFEGSRSRSPAARSSQSPYSARRSPSHGDSALVARSASDLKKLLLPNRTDPELRKDVSQFVAKGCKSRSASVSSIVSRPPLSDLESPKLTKMSSPQLEKSDELAAIPSEVQHQSPEGQIDVMTRGDRLEENSLLSHVDSIDEPVTTECTWEDICVSINASRVRASSVDSTSIASSRQEEPAEEPALPQEQPVVPCESVTPAVEGSCLENERNLAVSDMICDAVMDDATKQLVIAPPLPAILMIADGDEEPPLAESSNEVTTTTDTDMALAPPDMICDVAADDAKKQPVVVPPCPATLMVAADEEFPLVESPNVPTTTDTDMVSAPSPRPQSPDDVVMAKGELQSDTLPSEEVAALEIADEESPSSECPKSMEALHIAAMERLRYDKQTREERVNTVLMTNLLTIEPPPPVTEQSTGEGLIQQAFEGDALQNKIDSIETVRPSLANRFAERKRVLDIKVNRLREEYLTLHKRWLAHCAQLESHQKGFVTEETLPLPMGRNTRRSSAMMSDAVHSDLEFEQVMINLGIDDATDPDQLATRNLAKIPDMISVTHGWVDHVFDDTNHLVPNPSEFYCSSSGAHDWTREEEEIFLQKFALYPKQFGFIAEHLPNKTPAQCIEYYYLHKKLPGFRKALARFVPARRRGKRADKPRGHGILADIRQHDDEVARGTNGSAPRQTRRRTLTSTRISPLIERDGLEDDVNDHDFERKPKRSRKRKPKAASAPSHVEEFSQVFGRETKIGPSDPAPRRRSATSGVQWSEDDRNVFLTLLAQHGDDFKRIAAAMPNKTTIQVTNYYRSNVAKLQLDKIVAQAPKRSLSPLQKSPRESWNEFKLWPGKSGTMSGSLKSLNCTDSHVDISRTGVTSPGFHGATAAAGEASLDRFMPPENVTFATSAIPCIRP